tara:strand:- start:396 stop:713 length:318 start_codon:yes stop_codon:yes gene_type:complete
MMIGYCAIGQSGMYIITEKMGNPAYNEYFNDVYVTDPNGTTTPYSIPHFTADIMGHDSELVTIINGIINQGYEITSSDSWGTPYGMSAPGGTSYYFMRTIFLTVP